MCNTFWTINYPMITVSIVIDISCIFWIHIVYVKSCLKFSVLQMKSDYQRTWKQKTSLTLIIIIWRCLFGLSKLALILTLLLWGAKNNDLMSSEWQERGFYSIFGDGGTNFQIMKFSFLAFFEAKMTKIVILDHKLNCS